MSKLSKKLKSYLEDNPFVIYIGTVITIVVAVWAIFNVIYDLREQELNIMHDKAVNLLDEERSRIRIKLDGKVDYLDVDDIFVDGSEVPDNYARLNNTPFAIPPFYGNDKWGWKESNAMEEIEELMPDIDLSPEYKEVFELDKFQSYQKNEMDTIILFSGSNSYLRSKIGFQFLSKNDLANMKSVFDKIDSDVENNNSVESNDKNLKRFDFEMSKSELFDTFFGVFSLQDKSGINQVYGKMNETEYYFNKDVFLIYGYYNFSKDFSESIKRFYVLRMGFLREEGIYTVSFNMPIKEDYSELKVLNTLIYGFKIIN